MFKADFFTCLLDDSEASLFALYLLADWKTLTCSIDHVESRFSCTQIFFTIIFPFAQDAKMLFDIIQ